MKKQSLFKRCLLPLFFLSVTQFSYAQSVGVDYNTGALQINVPIYTVKRGDIVLPISVAHKGGGSKLKEAESLVGVGWNLVAGGSIIRELRDLPDDISTGWMFNGNAAKINAFNIANDNSKATCADETADRNYLNTNFSNLSDTEPDVFHLSLPGISCKLIFDGAGGVRTIPYQDIKVSWTMDPNPGSSPGIQSFQVVTNQGITYLFEQREFSDRIAKLSEQTSVVKFFKNVFDKYKNKVSYVRKWHLSKITAPGHQVDLTYTQVFRNFTVTTKFPYDYYVGFDLMKTKQFYIDDSGYAYVLDKISSYVGNPADGRKKELVHFDFNQHSSIRNLMTISAEGKSWSFSYKEGGHNTNYYRYFLSEIYSTSGGPNSYKFKYNELPKESYETIIKLPDSSSKGMDRWGYYNASLETILRPPVTFINSTNTTKDRFRYLYNSLLAPIYPQFLSGNLREVDSVNINVGSIKEVDINNGSITKIEYESNSYYDPQAEENVIGNGIRVKRLESSDKNDASGLKILTYSYLNPSTGFSSGKPISLPVFAFLQPYTGTGTETEKWRHSVVRSEDNFLKENDEILYDYVIERIVGQGSKRFEFSNPGMHFDSSAAPDWSPTIVNVAACSGGGFLVNEKNTYPFVPSMNFDFERKLPKVISTYNENNQKLTETQYTYTRIGTPFYIPGLRFESNNGILAYAKYRTVTGISKVIAEEKTINFDPTNITQQQKQVNYYYESPQHQYATRVDKQNSDGSINRTISRYSKDYAASGALATDTAATALKKMAEGNLNVLVERYAQLVRGSQIKTVSGELIRFSSASSNSLMPNPLQKLSFFNGSGVSDFQASSVTSGLFRYDSRYVPNLNFRAFNVYNFPVSTDNGKGISTSIFHDLPSTYPAAVFNQASPDEVIYSDFEFPGYMGFKLENNLAPYPLTEGRMSELGYILFPVQTLYQDLKKKKGSGWYVFSAWLKASSAGNLQLQVVNSANVGSTYTLPFSSAGDSWKYYVLRVPVSSMPDNFRFKLKSNVEVKMDDVLFYPTEATVNTTTYNPITFDKTSETDNNGNSRIYQYDRWGRLKQVSDEQKNILLRKSYVDPEHYVKFKPNIIATPDPSQITQYEFNYHRPIDFKDGSFDAVNPPEEQVKYTWDFGDGSPVINTTQNDGAVQHAYTAIGNYTVTLTKYSPIYGTMTDTRVINVVFPIIQIFSDYDLTFIDQNNNATSFLGTDVDKKIAPGIYQVRVGIFNGEEPYTPFNTSGFQWVGFTAVGPNGLFVTNGCQPSQPRVYRYTFGVDLRGKETISFSSYGYSPCSNDGGVE